MDHVCLEEHGAFCWKKSPFLLNSRSFKISWFHSSGPHRPSCLLNPVGFLVSNLTALPQHCSGYALVGRTTVVAPQSGAGQAVPCLAPKHTPTGPDTTGNLTNTDQPSGKWELLGQVTRKHPELGLLFPSHRAAFSSPEASAC